MRARPCSIAVSLSPRNTPPYQSQVAKLCEAMIKSDYLERHARVQEAHAQLLLVVVRDALGLVADDTVRQAVTMRIVDGLRTLPG